MRILYALHTWHPEGLGGTEAHARAVGEVLAARGHQVGVFTRCGRPNRPEYEVTTECQGRIGITRINNCFREAPTFEWTYRNRRIHEAFERELDEFKPDVVHVHHLTGLSTTIIESMKARGVPVVLTLHDFWTVCPRGQRMTPSLELCETVDRQKCQSCLALLWPHFFPKDHPDRIIVDQRGNLAPAQLAEWDRHMAYVLNLCDVLIAPSAAHRERMLDFPISPDRFIALPHGLDHGAYPEPHRDGNRPRRIGFIGTVIPVKGVHVLLEAFKKLGRPELSLEIYGEIKSHHEDAEYGQRLQKAARGMRQVQFHGAYQPEEVPAILKNIDLLVVPSLWWESFCLTLREGLLAGIPVLASDHGAMREALDGEGDGVLFKVGDADDLRKKLERLLDDPAWRAQYLDRRQSVKTLETYADEITEVYTRALHISAKRQGKIVIAPPAFPAEIPPPAAPSPSELRKDLPKERLRRPAKERSRALGKSRLQSGAASPARTGASKRTEIHRGIATQTERVSVEKARTETFFLRSEFEAKRQTSKARES